jgi:hypothetical protein
VRSLSQIADNAFGLGHSNHRRTLSA